MSYHTNNSMAFTDFTVVKPSPEAAHAHTPITLLQNFRFPSLRLFSKEHPLASQNLLGTQARTAGGAWARSSHPGSPYPVAESRGRGEQKPNPLASCAVNLEA